jgi:hypothetical protein
VNLIRFDIKKLIAVALVQVSAWSAHAAITIPEGFFGINYTEYSSYTTDNFAYHQTDLAAKRLTTVRIGGNLINTDTTNRYNKDFYVNAIQNVNAIGATPIVQLPISLAPADVASWIAYFNTTKGLGVTYFAVGNEPDPSVGWATWFSGTTYQDGSNYAQFKAKFIALAKAIKAVNTSYKVVGPDFRLWYGSEATGTTSNPFDLYYKDFLATVGTQAYNATTPLLDIFAFHFYGDKKNSEIALKYGKMMAFVNSANNAAVRSTKKLTVALGEVNGAPYVTFNPWDFSAGQFIATMMKHTLINGGQYAAPWGVAESRTDPRGRTDYGLYETFGMDPALDIERPTMWHTRMLSENKRTYYMDSAVEGTAYTDTIVTFGMKDSNGYTVMIMNWGNSALNYSANMNASAYSGTNPVRIKFDSGITGEKWNGTIRAHATLVYTFDSAGNRLLKHEFAEADWTVNYGQPTVAKVAEEFSQTNYYLLRSANQATLYARANPTAPGYIIQQNSPTVPTLNSYDFALLASTDANSSGYYYLLNRNTGKIFRPLNQSTAPGAVLEQVALAGGESLDINQWKPEMAPDGTYWLRNKKSQLFLRLAAGVIADGANLDQEALVSGKGSFKWDLVKDSAM